jgi:hypothetical protein
MSPLNPLHHCTCYFLKPPTHHTIRFNCKKETWQSAHRVYLRFLSTGINSDFAGTPLTNSTLQCPSSAFCKQRLLLQRADALHSCCQRWTIAQVLGSRINPSTPELNPSAQRCLTRFLLGILLLEPCISFICAWKTNKCNNYSFNLWIVYSSSYMFRHYIAIFRERS